MADTGFGEGAYGSGDYGDAAPPAPPDPATSGYGSGPYGSGPYGAEEVPPTPVLSGYGSGPYGAGPYGVPAPPAPVSGYGAGPYGKGVYGTRLTPVTSGYGSGAYGAGPYGKSPPAPIPGMPRFLLPDAMPDIKQWLHDHPYLNTLHGGRVYFRLPKTKRPKVPFVRIYRAGGGRQSNSEVPMQDLRVSIEVWGWEGRDYDAVRVLCNAIEGLVTEVPPGTLLGDNGSVVTNVNVSTWFDSPDPDTGMPRMIGDSVWTVLPSLPATVG